MTDQALFDALDELVPGCEREHGDWEVVLARAQVRRSPARRRLVFAAAIVLALVVTLVATPAFGLRSALLGLIGRTDVPFRSAEPAPAVVERQFEDLSLGAPPGMDPRAIAGQAREVATFESGGKKRVLWVAPTRGGGFCMTISHLWGGCRATRADRAKLPIGLTGEVATPRGEKPFVSRLGGEILAADAAKLEIDFADGTSAAVPFVYVSKPIDAGFFLYDVPAEHRRPAHGPTAVVARNSAGDVVARGSVRFVAPRPPLPGHLVPLPAQPLPRVPAPSAPLERGEDRGVEVVAGRNGVAVFRTTRPDPVRDELLSRGRVGLGCFRFRRHEARGYTILAEFRNRSAIRLYGVGTPFDGCEIQGGYGHVWPDRLSSHSAVEVAFTPAARRYFAAGDQVRLEGVGADTETLNLPAESVMVMGVIAARLRFPPDGGAPVEEPLDSG